MDSQLSNAVSDVLIRFLDDFLQFYLQPCPNGLKKGPPVVFTLHQPHFWPHINLRFAANAIDPHMNGSGDEEPYIAIDSTGTVDSNDGSLRANRTAALSGGSSTKIL